MKALTQLFAAALAAIVPIILISAPMGWSEWVNVGIIGLGAVNVFLATNYPSLGVWAYIKAMVSGVSAAGVVVVSALSAGISSAEWSQIAVAFIVGVGGVYAAPVDHFTRQPLNSAPTGHGRHELDDE